MKNQGENSYDHQQGSRDLEDRNNPANHLAQSLDDLERIKKNIDPEENKKKDPVPESMKPDQGSKTIMKLVAMALLIIGAVALGPGIGAAILGTLAGGAGLLAANDLLGASGKAPLQSKKSKRKEEQTDKMHKVEQKALDAALASVEKNIEQINKAPSMAGPIVAESRSIPAGSKMYNNQEIEEMVKKKVDDALKQQNLTDRQIGSRDPQSDSQNPSNSGRASPDSPHQNFSDFIRSSELRGVIQDVVAKISQDRDGGVVGRDRSQERERGGEREASTSEGYDQRDRVIRQPDRFFGQETQQIKATRPDSTRRSDLQHQSSKADGLRPQAAARSPGGVSGRAGGASGGGPGRPLGR